MQITRSQTSVFQSSLVKQLIWVSKGRTIMNNNPKTITKITEYGNFAEVSEFKKLRKNCVQMSGSRSGEYMILETGEIKKRGSGRNYERRKAYEIFGKMRRLFQLILCNFSGGIDGEYLFTGSFKTPVSDAAARKEVERFIQRLRHTVLHNWHTSFRYIAIYERSRKNRIHTHIFFGVPARMMAVEIKRKWTAGNSHIRKLVEIEIKAKYFTTSKKARRYNAAPVERLYSCSRNIIRPQVRYVPAADAATQFPIIVDAFTHIIYDDSKNEICRKITKTIRRRRNPRAAAAAEPQQPSAGHSITPKYSEDNLYFRERY